MNIDLFDDNQPTLQLAANELQGFIETGSLEKGGDFEELSYVFRKADVPGYSVVREDQKVVFIAPSALESLYAVYTFAEEILGFCFYQPGHDRFSAKDSPWQRKKGTLIEERCPLLKNRGFIQEYPADESNYRLADWMARNRLNYLLVWMKDYGSFTDDLKAYYEVRGIRIESGHHNFEYLIPLETYHRQHPEFFAIVNGDRIKPNESDESLFLSKQLCVTEPGLREELAKNLVAYGRQHPELDTVSLIPNDGFGWCECERCAAYYDKSKRGELFSVSAHVYPAGKIYHDFVKDIAARVHAELPGLKISLAAYINYVEPTEGFELTPGLAVHVAPYWRCIHHDLNDPDCPINSRYWEALKKWGAAKSGGDFNVYEYYMGVNMYVSLPMVHHRAVFRELQALAEIAGDGILTQFHLPHWTAYGLNYYLMAKAAYGEDESVVERVMDALFGEDADRAQAFYHNLRQSYMDLGRCHIPIPRAYMNRVKIEVLQELLDQANALAARSPEDTLRRNIVVWMQYLLRFKQLFDAYHNGEDVRQGINEWIDWIEAQKAHEVVVMPRLRRFLSAWIEAIDKGKPWLHFNIAWEDEYVRHYDTALN